jgi:hypothetical protein
MVSFVLAGSVSRQAGKETENVEPCPSALVTHTRPPCCSTMDLTIANPKPVP